MLCVLTVMHRMTISESSRKSWVCRTEPKQNGHTGSTPFPLYYVRSEYRNGRNAQTVKLLTGALAYGGADFPVTNTMTFHLAI
jgi:hypothetical protein